MKTVRHNFSKEVKMHLACGNDEFHTVLNYVYFSEGYAYASDSHVLVKNKISEISNFDEKEIKLLDGMIIHNKSFKELLKYDTVKVTEDGFDCVKGNMRSLIRFDKGDVRTEKHLKSMINVLQSAMGGSNDPIKIIRINIENIKTLNEAMFGGDMCKFFFHGEFNGVVLKPMDDAISSVGLVMPLNEI